MPNRASHELARVIKRQAQERAESAMTRVANEFGTVIDVDPLRILVHSSNMVLDEEDLYYATVRPTDLDGDDTVLLNVIGNHWVLVAEVGEDAFDKLAQRVTAASGPAQAASSPVMEDMLARIEALEAEVERLKSG